MIRLIHYTALSENGHRTLLYIRNHPDIRAHAHTREPIGWNDHLAWVDTLRGDETRRYYAVCDDEIPIGGVHWSIAEPGRIVWGIFFDSIVSAWVISGVTIRFLDRLFERHPASVLVSSIHRDNKPAIRFNRQLGFKPISETADFWTMELDEAGWMAQKEGKILRTILRQLSQRPINMEL